LANLIAFDFVGWATLAAPEPDGSLAPMAGIPANAFVASKLPLEPL